MNQLPTSAQVKQGARQLFSVATDKVKVVSANVQRGDTSVRLRTVCRRLNYTEFTTCPCQVKSLQRVSLKQTWWTSLNLFASSMQYQTLAETLICLIYRLTGLNFGVLRNVFYSSRDFAYSFRLWELV
jgi:hypothetical protein